MKGERIVEYATDLANNCIDWYAQDVDDNYIKGALNAVVAEQKQIDIENACKCYCDYICDIGQSCMCYHKHDDHGQIKKTFKYNECSNLELIRREMEK